MATSDLGNSISLPLLKSLEDTQLGVWVQLVRGFHFIGRQVSLMLAAEGMTLPQFDVLATLHFSANVTQQELAERLLVTKGNVCGVLDRLEKLGWVARQVDEHDRRANRLKLTDSGMRKIGEVLPKHNALILKQMKAVTSANAKVVSDVLNGLTRPDNHAD